MRMGMKIDGDENQDCNPALIILDPPWHVVTHPRSYLTFASKCLASSSLSPFEIASLDSRSQLARSVAVYPPLLDSNQIPTVTAQNTLEKLMTACLLSVFSLFPETRPDNSSFPLKQMKSGEHRENIGKTIGILKLQYCVFNSTYCDPPIATDSIGLM